MTRKTKKSRSKGLPKNRPFKREKGLPKARKFNGKKFEFSNEWTYKSDAQKSASRARKAGFKARVTKTTARGGGWRVYLRDK